MSNFDALTKIADRTLALLDTHAAGHDVGRAEIILDLELTSELIVPLRLADLAEAPDFDLLHDVLGLRQNLDRGEARLLNFFLPRYAAQQ